MLALLLVAGSARTSTPEGPPDALEGVLEASSVVIVTPAAGDTYQIEQTFLGTAKRGDRIEVPQIRLGIPQPFGPARFESITPDTHILMFLYFSRGFLDSPDGWQVTGYGRCFFWEQDPAHTNNLVNIARAATTVRKCWEAARDTSDKRGRVIALWPFLDLKTYGVSFQSETKKELEKTSPVAGDYIASKFASMDMDQRLTLLPQAGLYGGDRLHQLVRHFVRGRQAQYEAWVAQRGPAAKVKAGDWEHIPLDIQVCLGYLSYGLSGLYSFHDPADLPYLRSLAVWESKRFLGQVDPEFLSEFRMHPDQANLPVIETIWKAQRYNTRPGYNISPMQVIDAYSAGRYIAAIPLLVPFLSNKDSLIVAVAHNDLVRIAGKDLGSSPGAWLLWYGQHHPTPH